MSRAVLRPPIAFKAVETHARGLVSGGAFGQMVIGPLGRATSRGIVRDLHRVKRRFTGKPVESAVQLNVLALFFQSSPDQKDRKGRLVEFRSSLAPDEFWTAYSAALNERASVVLLCERWSVQLLNFSDVTLGIWGAVGGMHDSLATREVIVSAYGSHL